jgi:hypothetical protein
LIRFASCSSFLSRGRVSPRRATYFLLLRQKKVSKEKATLLSATLRFATGNLRCSRFAGSRSNSLRSNRASPDPRNAALLGAARRDLETGHAIASLGAGDTSGHRFARPGRSQFTQTTAGSSRLDTRSVSSPSGRAKQRPVSVSTPLWLRRGAERFADQGSPLFERSEFCETPRNASTAGCPQRSEGSQTVGSPFLCLRSFGEAKESKSPAGARPGLRPQQGKQR